MKILKLKSILFSLMAIAMVTVFLTSCEKETIEVENTEAQLENLILNEKLDNQNNSYDSLKKSKSKKGNGKIMIPMEYEDSTPEEIANFITNLSSEEIEARQNSYLIWRYLGYTKQLDQLVNDNPNFDILTFKDLNQYAPDQIGAFEEFSLKPPPELFSLIIFDECIWGFIHIVLELVCEGTFFPPGIECRLVVSIDFGPC